ncbi:hypothetical protein J1614_010213 [Plenodomus biglobosus]|nr:hypothetical protein J1614_010213 [Plenodomus biglobosus]
MATAVVDVGYLAASYSVPEATFHSLLSEPTVELVESLLTQIEAKARAYDDLQSEKVRADVELEAAVQGGEQRARALKSAAEKAQREAEEARQQLAKEESARQQVEKELHTLQTTATTSTSEVHALESRIKTLESQNRDAIAMHEAKVAAHDRLAQELSEQHQKSIELRKQLSALEEKNQSLESAASNVKFRETNLQQEIEALRKNNDWYTTELKKRSDDHSKHRKEKSAQIAQLLRENADASETIDALRRTEATLRQHIAELQSNADEDRKRIDELERQASELAARHQIELDSANRLAELHKANSAMEKQHAQSIQATKDQLEHDAATEIGLLQAELEEERNRANAAEAELANAETLVENLTSENREMRSSVRMPATPRHGMNGNFGTPGRAGSPAPFSPGGTMIKADATRTQLLIENNDLKKELRKVREKAEEASTVTSELLREMDARVPEFEELRRENDALTEQCSELTNLLNDVSAERESACRDARKAQGDLEGVQKECALLRHQVQDMTIQVRSLMWRREAEDNGLDSLPADQKQFILDSVNNQVPDHALPSDSVTHNLITKHLVLYQRVADLQEQHSNALNAIRQLADEHEAQEARNKLEQHKKDHEELVRLRSKIGEKEEEIKTLTVRAQTFKAERDMYFRSIPKRDSLSESQSNPAFAQSVPAGHLLLEQTAQKDNPDYNKLVEDLKAHIDLLKTESATNNTTNKSQIDSLTKSNNQLQSDKARLETQVRREQDRYTRLESTIKMLQQEKETLQDRYNNVQATLAKQDDRIVKADQEVAEATTRIQGLESELVHLKASQQVAQSTEARLKERNQELMDERDRLSKLVSDVQSLRNEFELTATNTRRELQAKVEKQEADLQITQRKLEDEIADHKKAIQQRDYERMEAQRRIDDLIAARNSAEVKSASADSVRQQLEQRVKDLQNQLQIAEDRLDALQPRTTGSGDQEDESMSREEELTAQVADLQRKLERKQEDLDLVNSQIEGFQNIAQDAEERLQSFVEAHERLQEELNMAQEEKDAKINDLQQRVEDISSELAASSTELTELRGKHEQEALQLSQQKDLLETEISRLKNDVADYKEEAAAQAEFVKTQADIAARAQQDYEAELAKHGQTMEKLRSLRDEQDQLKADIAQFKAQAEAARTTLEQSQEYWKTTQGQLEEQITDAKRRHDDLKQYNQTLLNQFDEYKAQIDNLKHNRVTVAGGETSTMETGSNNLQDIETYLRREKEILEVQLNLKEQEAKRLEHQLAHAQTQLDQTREKLIAEQSKAQGSQSSTSIQTLQDRIQELNVYRESNMTLRNDNTRLLNQLAEKTKALEDLQSELEPLQTRVSELEGELELNVGHLKAVEEDRDRWQKRHQDVLQRYDRIDPKELEDLKQQIESLKMERDQALEQVTVLTQKITELEVSQQNIVAETREATIQEVKATETAKARNGFNKVHNEKMKQKATEIEGLTTQRDELQGELTALKQELEQSQQQLSVAQSGASQSQQQMIALQQQLEQSHANLATAQQELQTAKAAHDAGSAQPNTTSTAAADVNMSEDGQVQEGDADVSSEQLTTLRENLDKATKRALTAESNYNVVQNQMSGLQVQLSMERQQVATLEKEIAEKGNTIVELREQLTQAQNQPSQQAPVAVAAEPATDSSAASEIEKLGQELTAARKEVEDLRTQLDAAKESTNNSSQAGAPKANEETESIKAALDKREVELKALEAEVNRRLEEVQIKEAKQAALVKKANDKIRQIRAETDKELENLKTAHTTELERLREEKQSAASSADQGEEKQVNTPAAPDSDELGAILGLPTETAEGQVVRDFIQKNQTAKDIVRLNVNKRVAVLNEQASKAKAETETLRAEYEKLKALVPSGDTSNVKEESAQNKSDDHEAELANIKAEHERMLKEALAKKEEVMARTAQLKGQLKENQINSWKAKWAVFEKAAHETPTEEVAKVYAIAKNPPKPTPKPSGQPNTPAKQGQVPQPGSAQPAPQTPAQTTPAAQEQQTATPASTAPQPNGASMSVGEPAPAQSNPFTQSASSVNGGSVPVNPFFPQAQMGRGLPQPGFTAPASAQQQQIGLGRGGLQAIRGAIQSNIPRGGGTGIPLPGGRGRGQQNMQNMQNMHNMQNMQQGQQQANAAVSQIGRGGGRGGRGRGGAQQGGGSPGGARGGMNPGAQQFQPGPGAGRGIKRGAEDEGDGGATRGGKRARGGRGGQGGAE